MTESGTAPVPVNVGVLSLVKALLSICSLSAGWPSGPTLSNANIDPIESELV